MAPPVTLHGSGNGAAFSLVELLLTLAILVLLLVIGFPIYERALLHSDASRSVNNVRNLQLANIQYSADNNGWYVPFNIIRDGDIYSGQWLRNPAFQKTLGITSFPYGRTYYPPGYLSPRSTSGRHPDGYGPISRSYGYNDSVFGANKGKKEIYQIKASQVLRPATLMAFADALDFWVVIEFADNYQGREESVKGGVAYRYGGKAAVAFFDGHAALLRRDQIVGNQALWLNQ